MLMELFNSILTYYIGSLSVIRGFGGGGRLSSDLHGQNKFHYNTKTLLASFCFVEICTDGAKSVSNRG